MRVEREWGGSDILMRLEMEQHRAVLEEYEAAAREARDRQIGALLAISFSLGCWGVLLLIVLHFTGCF